MPPPVLQTQSDHPRRLNNHGSCAESSPFPNHRLHREVNEAPRMCRERVGWSRSHIRSHRFPSESSPYRIARLQRESDDGPSRRRERTRCRRHHAQSCGDEKRPAPSVQEQSQTPVVG